MPGNHLGFDHAAIACRDVERMLDWYQRALGFQVAARRPPSAPGVASATYLAGPPGSSVTIELMPAVGMPLPARSIFTPGISHLALRVDDIRQWEARLSSLGVEWLGEAAEATGGGKVRSFLDPEGNLLQIVQRT